MLEFDRYVDFSGRLLLECEECGENLILLGLEDDWDSQPSNFECGCGKTLTLEDRVDEEALAIRKLMRDSSGGRNAQSG